MNHHDPAGKVPGTGSCPICGGDRAAELLSAPDRFHGREEVYRLLQCRSCSLVWLADPPRPEEMAYHYGTDYHKGITTSGEADLAKWQRRRQVILQHKSRGALLDLGCSSGVFLKTFQGESWDLYGVEMDASQASRARKESGAQVFLGDVLDAPFPAGSFDVITGFHILEHHHDPQRFLRKVREWLKPGGIFYLLLPNIGSWEARAFRSYWYGLEMPRHLYHFSPRSLRCMATAAGLREARLVTPADSYMEHSLRYVFDDFVRQLGLSRAPLADGRPAGVPLKVIRRAFRVSFELAFRQAASLAGAGASIEAIFQR